jgi:hypothetical protein
VVRAYLNWTGPHPYSAVETSGQCLLHGHIFSSFPGAHSLPRLRPVEYVVECDDRFVGSALQDSEPTMCEHGLLCGHVSDSNHTFLSSGPACSSELREGQCCAPSPARGVIIRLAVHVKTAKPARKRLNERIGCGLVPSAEACVVGIAQKSLSQSFSMQVRGSSLWLRTITSVPGLATDTVVITRAVMQAT